MLERRNFLSLASAGVGAAPQRQSGGDFYFAQVSDSRWGYREPDQSESAPTLRKAVAAIHALADPPHGLSVREVRARPVAADYLAEIAVLQA